MTAPRAAPDSGLVLTGRLPAFGFRARDLEPSVAGYIGPADRIFWQAFNADLVLQAVTFTGRILLPDLTVNTFVRTLSPATGTSASELFVLGECVLLGAAIVATAATPRGRVYVSVTIQRGDNPNTQLSTALMGGYTGGSVPLGWPGSPVYGTTDYPGAHRTYAVATPGPGADWSDTVPSQMQREYRSISAVLTTGAAAGNRVVTLRLLDLSGRIVYSAGSLIGQTPSTVLHYTWAEGVANNSADAAGVVTGLPAGVKNRAAGQALVVTGNLAAGDQWSAIAVEAEEWVNQ